MNYGMVSYIDNLPDEILVQILEKLDIKSFNDNLVVCSRWRNLIKYIDDKRNRLKEWSLPYIWKRGAQGMQGDTGSCCKFNYTIYEPKYKSISDYYLNVKQSRLFSKNTKLLNVKLLQKAQKRERMYRKKNY